MSLIRKLNNGTWNKPPVLTAARLIFAKGLAEKYPGRKLGDLAHFVNGTSYDRGRLDMGDTPIIRISNITDPTSDFIKTDEQFPERYHVSQGDLLVSWSASFKSILWPGPEGILNQHIFKVTERDGHVRSYIRHAIEAAFDEMQRNVVGMGMMHLRRGDFLGHRVPCPPADIQSAVADYLDWVENCCDGEEPQLPEELMEQWRIVAKIERLAARIDGAEALRHRSHNKCHAMLSGAIQEVMEEGVRPEDWRSFGAYDPHVTSGPRSWSRYYSQRGHRFYRAQDIGADFTVLSGSKQFLTPPPGSQGRTALLGAGDLMIVITGATVGRAAVFDETLEPGFVSQHVAICRLPQSQINPQYALWHLRGRTGQEQLLGQRYGQGKPGLNLTNIRNLSIPYRPLEEQRRVVTYLDHLQTKMDCLKGLQQKTAAELDALLPSILDKAFKGEL